MAAAAAAEEEEEEEEGAGGSYCSVEELQSSSPPAGVDSSRKEDYLNDTAFEGVFGMSRAAFSTMPQWKKSNKKKAAGLF